MSDESCYFSPGEVPEDEKENDGIRSDDPLFRSLMSDFQDDLKTNGNKQSSNREPMKVFLRIRPFSNEELKASEAQGCLKLVDEKTVLLQAPQDSFTFKSSIRGIAEQTHQFKFSRVYNDNTSQKDIFYDSILGYVKDFLDGINCLVFTYGVTNSGKTFTIQGNPKNGGILPRTLDVLFNSIKGKQYEGIDLKPTMYQDVTKLSKDQQKYEEVLKNAVTHAGQRENIDLSLLWKMDTTSQSDTSTISASSATSGSYITANDTDYSSISDEVKERICDGTVLDTVSQGPVKFSIWVSFAEIYNEYVYDLLDPTPPGKGKKRPVLKLGDDKKGNPYVKGLKEIQVNSADEAFTVVRVGQKNQNIAATKLNQNSSRSHSIFTIKILRVVDVDEPHVVRISRLSFVDLAGSERHCKTQSTGDRLKEASNINTSIMTLGKCIEYLRYNQQHKNHPLIVPFRETKLTRLFQGFFLGRGKAAMIVNISQCASVFDETYNVLKFSAIAKQVKTNSTRNTELFKPKNLPKPSLTTATPLNSNKSNWLNAGLTTPRPAGQKAMICDSMCDDDHNDQFHALVASYEELRKQLIDERRKNALMELKIREEVCAEMSEQLVEIERDYSARLQEEQQTLEEQCERRIEMLTKSMKKSRKRKKIDRIEDEEDSYVSSVLLHAEKTKVKERDETIRTLRAKLAEKEMAHELYKQAHTPDQHPKAIKTLQGDLDEATETLKLHESHIDELQTKLNAVQETLEEREIEIEKLKEIADASEQSAISKEINQLKDLLQERNKMLDDRGEELKEKEDEIAKLHVEMASNKENTASKSDLEAFEKELAKLEGQGKMLRDRNDFQCSENRQLRTEKDDIEAKHKLALDKISELKRQLEENEDRREQLQFKDEERNTKIKRFENIIRNHETALAESENIIEQLNEKIDALKSEVNILQADKECLKNNSSNGLIEESRNAIEQDEKMKNLREKMAELEQNKNLVERENRELKARALALEKELVDIEKGTENEAENLHRKLDSMAAVLAAKEKDVETAKKDWQAEVKEMTEMHTEREIELKRKIDIYANEMEEMKKKIQNIPQNAPANEGCDGNTCKGSKERIAECDPRVKDGKKGVLVGGSALGAMKGIKAKASLRPSCNSRAHSPFKSNVTALKEMERALKETATALDKKNEQVMSRNQMIADLQKKIEGIEKEVEVLKLDLMSSEKAVEEAKYKAEAYQKEADLKILKLKDELMLCNKNVLHKEEEIKEIKRQNVLIMEDKHLLEKNAENVAKTLEEYNTYNDECKKEIEELKRNVESLQSRNDGYKQEIINLSDRIKDLETTEAEFRTIAEENRNLKGKVESLENLQKQLSDLKLANEKLRCEIDDIQKKEILHLNSEIKGLKVENSGLIDDISNKNSDLRSIQLRLNQTCEENVNLTTNLHEANEKISSLELQIQLGKTEKELNSMHAKEQVMNALVEASKKEELSLKKFSNEIAEQDHIIKGLKNELEERKSEIEELTNQLENEMETKRELVKKQQLVHDLRCTIVKKDEELKERTGLQQKVRKLEEDLKKYDELKFQKETMMMQMETLKRSLKERDTQIAAARNKIEQLERELKEQIERDRNFQSPQSGVHVSSDQKIAAMPTAYHASLRRSTRIQKNSTTKKIICEENDLVFEDGSASKKRGTGRKVLFDLNENSAPDVLEADTPGSAKTDKPKRRKLLAKNTGIGAESPQVIPPSPTKQKDEITAVVRRQLRSSCRK